MRKPPQYVKPQLKTDPTGLTTISRTIRFVTPIFGGGVSVESDELKRQLKVPDPVSVVRTASIVGQVRFWWRATTGARMESLTAMREREAELFGEASTAGNVRLRVEGADKLKSQEVQVWESRQGGNGRWNPAVLQGKEAIAYGAFPLQAKAGQTSRIPSGVLHNISGDWTASWTSPEEHRAELELAIDAWILFGGLGGRTRRGFGALDADDVTLDAFSAAFGNRDAAKTLPDVSALRLNNLSFTRNNDGSPQEAHNRALGALRRFRQGVGVGRNTGQGPRPGRSFWPEPNAIRAMTGQSAPQHSDPWPYAAPLGVFPRAVFGMPIIFHFQGGGDPADTQLVPEGRTRMASPVLLRPIRKGQAWQAACIVLADSGRANLRVELKRGNQMIGPVQWKPSKEQADAISRGAKALGFGEGRTMAHNAFVHFFQTC